MAPTEIIYRIATNYILGFDEEMKEMTHNFRLADAVKAPKAGTLDEISEKEFGN